MENIKKVYFDPLLRGRDEIQAFVKTLPVGSAHVFEKSLLVHSEPGQVTVVDISMHPEDYFLNAVNLSALGEDVLSRLELFPEIAQFNKEYTIQQAPSSTFRVPIVDGEIHIFALSELDPTYYDLCIGGEDYKTACYAERFTFKGIEHSGDRIHNSRPRRLLQHIKIDSGYPADKPLAVFVSGFEYQKLRNFREHNPLVVVANHSTKTLYIIPVPLDPASIGNATICSPLVIKKDADGYLVCSILPAPATDEQRMCSGSSLKTEAFKTAIQRAAFTIEPERQQQEPRDPKAAADSSPENTAADEFAVGTDVVIATHSVTLPAIPRHDSTQIIRFGKGLHWMTKDRSERQENGSLTVLPIVLGDVLEGPMALAIGEGPTNVPFRHVRELHQYYEQAKSILVVVDDKMLENVRNLATTFRLNGIFIVQSGKETPRPGIRLEEDIRSILYSVNINAVTALAGPQSLILVQIGKNYYYYRGIADPNCLDTSTLQFGHDLTDFFSNPGLDLSKLAHPDWSRVVDLSQKNPVFLLKMNLTMQLSELEDAFRNRTFAEISLLKGDILGTVPQLQTLLSQEKLQSFCSSLIEIVQEKVTKEVSPIKKEYMTALHAHLRSPDDAELRKEKDRLLGVLRRKKKEAQDAVQWLTQALGNIVSTQTTSSGYHDLNRLRRQKTIQDNVSAAKNMDFEQVADMLDEHAGKMGVLIINVDEAKYHDFLRRTLYLQDISLSNDLCALDPRALFLDGLTAGCVLDQTQENHSGPLVSQMGTKQPVFALANTNTEAGGSMLAWVCWDEFVDLENPYKVRWMEKCNDAHIAAARIIMRGTISDAVISREFSFKASSPAVGQIMASLLMIAIKKLAATRSSPPSEVNADDTTTLLMRGLFGNLLSTAGSGTKPISFVWQLFGVMPNFEVPSDVAGWSWYETAARFLPYTGWPMHQFKKNLKDLLDKMIFRLITVNEIKGAAAAVKKSSLADYCRARNIQLLHSRTIITILKKMLTSPEDCKDIAKRLLEYIPEHVEHESESYKRLHRYIVYLAGGGARRSDDNLVAAGVFAKRASPFKEAKKELSNLCRNLTYTDGLVQNPKPELKENIVSACKQLFEIRSSIEKEWGLEPKSIRLQNSLNIQKIHDKFTSATEAKLSRIQVESCYGDAEKNRIPWLLGDGTKYGSIEELDKDFMNKILLGDDAIEKISQAVEPITTSTAVVISIGERLGEFKELMKPGFLGQVEKASTAKDVCNMLKITYGAMEAFMEMISPGFDMEKLPDRFKEVVVALMSDRSRGEGKAKPMEMLLK